MDLKVSDETIEFLQRILANPQDTNEGKYTKVWEAMRQPGFGFSDRSRYSVDPILAEQIANNIGVDPEFMAALERGDYLDLEKYPPIQ